jgi:hypothetical protein
LWRGVLLGCPAVGLGGRLPQVAWSLRSPPPCRLRCSCPALHTPFVRVFVCRSVGWGGGVHMLLRCHHSETGEMLWTVADGHRSGMTSLALSGNERFTVRSCLLRSSPAGTLNDFCRAPLGWGGGASVFFFTSSAGFPSLLPACLPSFTPIQQITGGALGDVRVWEMRSRELVSDLKEHVGAITGIVRGGLLVSPLLRSRVAVGASVLVLPHLGSRFS